MVLLVYLFVGSSVHAQTLPTPTPTPQQNALTDTGNSNNGALSSFFSGFDWISSGLIFSTPDVTGSNIILHDGTQLAGISEYRNIFYDISIPLFAVIVAFVSLSHITSDNIAQLQNFGKRLVVVTALFILTPYVLSYSIEFINLLNDQISQQHAYNLASFIIDYLNSGDLAKTFGFLISPALFINFSLSALMQLLVLLISVGFLLFGFIYIVFQSVIRFVALLFLSVLFPLVLPFALSEKTENITNMYFKTWFTFLIQQPAFVLGFALVSALLTSILKAHGGNIGTLFLYAGSLFFLGGVNIFIGKIFGDSWGVLSTNAQSMVGNRIITGFGKSSYREIHKGAFTGNTTGIRSYAGSYLGTKLGLIKQQPAYSSTQGEDSSSYIGSSREQFSRKRTDSLHQMKEEFGSSTQEPKSAESNSIKTKRRKIKL